MACYLSAISTDRFFFFQNFHISNFYNLFSLKFQKTTSATVSVRFHPNIMINRLVMGGYRLLLLKNKDFMALWKFLLTQDHIVLEISKRSSYSFRSMTAKLHVDIGYHGSIQAWLLQKIVALRNFNMGVNGKILKCAISSKRLIGERDENLGLAVLGSAYVGHFSCQILWVQFGVIRCTLQNFRWKNFQKATAPTFFIQFQPDFMESMIIRYVVGYFSCRILLV